MLTFLQIPSSQPSISNKLSSFSYPIKAFWLIQSPFVFCFKAICRLGRRRYPMAARQ
jgi:hypothetical protein